MCRQWCLSTVFCLAYSESNGAWFFEGSGGFEGDMPLRREDILRRESAQRVPPFEEWSSLRTRRDRWNPQSPCDSHNPTDNRLRVGSGFFIPNAQATTGVSVTNEPTASRENMTNEPRRGLRGSYSCGSLASMPAGFHCRLSLRERTSFRGAKGDNDVTSETHNVNHAGKRTAPAFAWSIEGRRFAAHDASAARPEPTCR